MLHLRAVCPSEVAPHVVDALTSGVGVIGVQRLADCSDGAVVVADLARESADSVLRALDELDVRRHGMITLLPLDTAFGQLVDDAERQAPGAGADAVVWDELLGRSGEDSTFTGAFAAFIVLATLLAGIGVVTDSPITVVGAMVVGPEFGPLAAIAVGIVRRRTRLIRSAVLALVLGFPLAIVVTTLAAVVARACSLISANDVVGQGRNTEFIYHPGWFSLITALVAGAAGMLSLTSSKSAALVGVFISVTTIPAAGNAAVAGVLGHWNETWQSLAQLGINLAGIVAAGVATLLVLRAAPTDNRRGARADSGAKARFGRESGRGN